MYDVISNLLTLRHHNQADRSVNDPVKIHDGKNALSL